MMDPATIASPRQTFSITVPEGTHSGDEIELAIRNPAMSPRRRFLDTSLPITKAYIADARNRAQIAIAIWWCLESLILILLGFGIGSRIMPFAVLTTSEGCGQAQTNFYFNLFLGVGTQEKECTDAGNDVCVPWTSSSWASYVTASGADHMGSYYVSINSALYAAQVLYILAIIFCLLAWTTHSVLLLDVVNSSNAYCCFLSSGYLLLISFAVALSSMINASSSPAFLTFYWNQYFRKGGSLEVLKVGNAPLAPAEDLICKTSLYYKGGACLATSIAILFVLMVWVLFSACMYGAIIFDDVDDASPAYQTEFAAASGSAISSDDSPKLDMPKGIKPSTGAASTTHGSAAHAYTHGNAKPTEAYTRSAEVEEGKGAVSEKMTMI